MSEILVEKYFWETSTFIRHFVDLENGVYRLDEGDLIELKSANHLPKEELLTALQAEIPDMWLIPSLCTVKIYVKDKTIEDLLPLFLLPDAYSKSLGLVDFPDVISQYADLSWDEMQEAIEVIDRLVFVNGYPWITLSYTGHMFLPKSCVVPLSKYALFSSWAQFGCGETMSMTSGLDISFIGLLTDETVMEISQLDDDSPYYSVIKFSGDEVDHLLRWFESNAVLHHIGSTWVRSDFKVLETLFAHCIDKGGYVLEEYAGEMFPELSESDDFFGMGLTDTSIWTCSLNVSTEIRQQLRHEIEKI